MGVLRGPDFKPVENMLLEGASFSQQSDLHLCKIILLPDNQVNPTPKVKRSQRSELFSRPKIDAKVPKVQIPQNWQNCKKCQNSLKERN